jgi:hypothetical protein
MNLIYWSTFMRRPFGLSAFWSVVAVGLVAAFTFISSMLVQDAALAQENGSPFPRDAKRVQDSEVFAIWDGAWQKGQSTGMQKLEMDQVSVTLADGALRVTKADGTWTIEQERFGSVRFEPKGTVVAKELVSETPSRVVVFQVKDVKITPWERKEGVPGHFPRVNTVKLFETDRIAVWDQTWKPGDRITRHVHIDRVAAVFLDGGSIRSISGAGVPGNPFSRKPGDVINTTSPNLDPHEEEGLEGPPRAIWVQFK